MEELWGLPFLIAAKQSEIGELVELTRTADLMLAVADLVHELQRERGLTSVVVASAGQRFAQERLAQLAHTDAAQERVEELLKRLDPQRSATQPAAQGSRLYARLAQALQAQAALPAIRLAVQAGQMPVARSTAVYVRIVSAWLTLVFEAADMAADADVSRMLVSLFHLMQAKELAGQERAAGSALFAAGRVTADDRLRVKDLCDAQETSMAGFADFAPAAALESWSAVQSGPVLRDRQRLRRLLLDDSTHGALNPALSPAWFDACTACMDALRTAQDALLVELRQSCRRKCAVLEAELSALFRLAGTEGARLSSEQALAVLEAEDPAQAQDAPAAVQVMALLQSQARRLQTVSAELDAARAALQERKTIERAKGALMAGSGLSEEEAYQAMRRLAMDRGQRLGEVALSVLRRTN